MDRIDHPSGGWRQRADRALEALERASLARIECGGLALVVLADLRNYRE